MTSDGTGFSDGAARYRQYVSANASFNAYEDAFRKEAVLLNGVILNTAKHRNPDISAVEATLERRDDLMDASINANRQYCWWFRDSKPGEPWPPDTLMDRDSGK
ncbi:MAG: hypothetical protein MMC33_004696 [Icmadophila ericetorum]|nr:hypothetical protein [Icmadophila ericetorum]